MSVTGEDRADLAVAFVSLTAEAAELNNRVTELRQELADVRERMNVISAALNPQTPGR
jgi:predicted  nucleic acid-binding Zn-ribbon protein